MRKYTIMVPVDFKVETIEQVKNIYRDLKLAGASMEISDGTAYDIRTDKLTLKSMLDVFNKGKLR
jgi:hypothetical protein